MTTAAQDEASRQSGRPIEFYDVVLSTGVTYRIASGNRDLQVGLLVYKATASVRTEITVPQASGNDKGQLTLSLPVDHPVVQRWFQLGSPPRQTTVTCWRKQERSGEVVQAWTGLVTSISCDGNVAKLLVPSRTIDTMGRTLPTITSGRTCPHILYDTQCRIARASFLVSTTAISVDGRTIRVDMGASHGVDWSDGGELVHVPTGERMTIEKQTDIDPAHSTVADLDIERPIPELKTGDALQIYAGCNKSLFTCKVKFANVPNFGGSPRAPTRDVFLYGDRIIPT